MNFEDRAEKFKLLIEIKKNEVQEVNALRVKEIKEKYTSIFMEIVISMASEFMNRRKLDLDPFVFSWVFYCRFHGRTNNGESKGDKILCFDAPGKFLKYISISIKRLAIDEFRKAKSRREAEARACTEEANRSDQFDRSDRIGPIDFAMINSITADQARLMYSFDKNNGQLIGALADSSESAAIAIIKRAREALSDQERMIMIEFARIKPENRWYGAKRRISESLGMGDGGNKKIYDLITQKIGIGKTIICEGQSLSENKSADWISAEMKNMPFPNGPFLIELEMLVRKTVTEKILQKINSGALEGESK